MNNWCDTRGYNYDVIPKIEFVEVDNSKNIIRRVLLE
jgi:hypothetical protein